MCLLLAAHDCCPGYRLIVAANRDEYHTRPAAAADWWNEPEILAGRDLESGGTWLGLTATGRFATVTNVRSGFALRRGPRSRGLIVTDFLASGASAENFAGDLARSARDYDGFNLLAHDGSDLVWYSNQVETALTLPRGAHTLSNARLDTRWPKTERLRSGFDTLMARRPSDPIDPLLDLLRDARRAHADTLPDTGIGRDMESVLSSIFIEGAGYGTRCSTIVTIGDDGHVCFHERRYDAAAAISGESRYEFELSRAAA